jgi:hypothetical protein
MEIKTPKKLTLAQIAALEFHPFANLFPLLKGAELDELTQDIDAHGLKEPIVIFENKILDGRNRYNAMRKLGLGTAERAEWYPFAFFYSGFPYGVTDHAPIKEQAVAYVISKNIMRRHLTDGQRAAIAAKLYAKMPKRSHGGDGTPSSGKPELALPEQVIPSAEEQKQKAADMLKVSKTALEVAAAVGKADPEKLEEVAAGKKKLAAAHEEVKAAKAPKQQPKQQSEPQPKQDQHEKIKDWKDVTSGFELIVYRVQAMGEAKEKFPYLPVDDAFRASVERARQAINKLADLLR